MYVVSGNRSIVEESTLAQVELVSGVVLPSAYRSFLMKYGEGTYRGWMNVARPDEEVLKPFAEYGLWEHDDDSPITEEQIGSCVSLGTSVDGDFLAVHPEVEGLLWLPRHNDRISLLQPADGDYPTMLDAIYQRVYERSAAEPSWFEPWYEERTVQFYIFTKETRKLSLPSLAQAARERWHPDFIIENEYSCKLFYRPLGGYLRFNYATETEVAVLMDCVTSPLIPEMTAWLEQHGGRRMS